MLIDCLKKIKGFAPEEVEEMTSAYTSAVEGGASKYEASIEAVTGYHKGLVEQFKVIRPVRYKAPKKPPYTIPDEVVVEEEPVKEVVAKKPVEKRPVEKVATAPDVTTTVAKDATTQEPLRAIPSNPLDGIIELKDGERQINYERVKDVARRVESGELEIRKLDPAGERGRLAGGRKALEATIFLASDEARRETSSQGGRADVGPAQQRQEKLLEYAAKATGDWYDWSTHFGQDKAYTRGGEAFVYRKDDNHVLKTVDYRHIDKGLTPLGFLDNRIALFNTIFPDTKYELVGYTRDGDGKFRFVVKQVFIDVHGVKRDDVIEYMRGKGFEPTSTESYANKLYQVHDLHEKNAAKDADGTIYVIDAVPKLNEGLYQPFDVTVEKGSTTQETPEPLRSVPDENFGQSDYTFKESDYRPSVVNWAKDNIGNFSEHRWSLPTVRGGWTKDKIRRALRQGGLRRSGNAGIAREIARFDSPQEFADHLFYHGTGGGVSGSLLPSILMSEAEAARSGGGGYGERYWAISLSKNKNLASNFTGMSRYGTVYPVVLKKGASVISLPHVEDAAELEEFIESLWDAGIDAVRLGDWSSPNSEQELAVLNPQAIFKYNKSTSFPVFNKERIPSLTEAEIEQAYNTAVANVPKLKEIQTLPKPEREEALKELPSILLKQPENRADLNELKTKYLDELAPDVKTEYKGENVVEINAEASEVIRTALAAVQDTKREAQAVVGSLFTEPQNAAGLIEAIDEIGIVLDENGIDTKQVKALVKNIEKASDKDGTVIFDGGGLEHEKVHYSSWKGADGKKLVDRYANIDEIAKDKDFKQFWGELNKLQGKSNIGVAAEEALAYLGSGDYARFGLTEEQAVGILQKLVNGYAEANGVESLRHFEAEKIYEAIENLTKGESSQSSDDSRGAVGEEREAGPRPAEAESDAPSAQERFAPGGPEKLSKSPTTMRGNVAAFEEVEDRTYLSTTNDERQEFANSILDKGITHARNWLDEQIKNGDNNAGATQAVGLTLMNHYAQNGGVEAMNEIAKKIITKGTDNAQAVQAMSMVSQFDPASAAAYASLLKQRKTGKDLTGAERRKATDIATTLSETAKVEGIGDAVQQDLENYINELTAENEAIKEALANKPSESKTDVANLKRQLTRWKNKALGLSDTAGRMTRTHQELLGRKSDILERLRQKFPDAALRMVAWHGSPHTFDKFSTEKIGTGEGAQAYGHGLYFTDKEAVADHYKKKLSEDTFQIYVDDVPTGISVDSVDAMYLNNAKTWEGRQPQLERIAEWLYQEGEDKNAYMLERMRPDQTIEARSAGAKYRVELKPAEDEYLDWDKPLSEQGEKVKKALEQIVPEPYEYSEQGDYWVIPKADNGKDRKLPTDTYSERDVQEVVRSLNKAVDQFNNDNENRRGEDFYRQLSSALGTKIKNDGEASRYLHSLGIRGIRYLDGTSRNQNLEQIEAKIAVAKKRIAYAQEHKNAGLLETWQKKLADAEKELANVSYNYVIFDDSDVEILEVLRSTPSSFDDNTRQDLIDYSALNILEGKSYDDVIKHLNDVTKGVLNEAEVKSIHANAVMAIRGERPSTTMDEATRQKIKNRNQHVREAKKFQGSSKNPNLSRLEREIANIATDDKVRISAIIQARTPDLKTWNDLISEVYDLDKTETRELYRKGRELRDEAKKNLERLRRQNETELKLSEDDLARIKEERRVNNALASKTRREADNFYNGLVRSRADVVADTIVNARRANLLTGIKTHFKNILGNTVFGATEEVGRIAAWLADRGVGLVTGEKTVGGINAKSIINSFYNTVAKDEVFKNIDKETGIEAAKHILRYGDSQENMERMQHSESVLAEKFPGRPAKWIDNYINGVFRTLGAEDAIFKVYAFRRSLEEQAAALAKTEDRKNWRERRDELLRHPTETMQIVASDFANFMTFQNDNILSNLFTKFKRLHPGVRTVAETIVPYDRTPTNIVIRVAEHLPIAGQAIAAKQLLDLRRGPDKNFRNRYRGAVQTDLMTSDEWNKLDENAKRKAIDDGIAKVWSREKQAKFARTVGRSSLGSSLFFTGFGLAALGLLTGSMGPEDDDKKETGEFFDRRSKGIENKSLLIPGVGRFVLPDDPASKTIAAGATFYEQMMMSKGDVVSKAWDAAGEVTKDAMFEQPLMGNVGQLYQTIKKGKYGEFAGQLLGGMVPTMASDVGEVLDDKARTTSGYKPRIPGTQQTTMDRLAQQGRGFRNSFLRRIPLVRQFADESKAVPSEIRGGILRRAARMIDPFNTRPATSYTPPEAKPSVDNYLNSPEFKKATTDDLVDVLMNEDMPASDRDKIKDALKKKALNARKAKSLTQEEVDRIKKVLPDFNITANDKKR